MPLNYLRGLLKQIAGLWPQSFWFSRSGWGPRICFSTKFPDGADAVGLGALLREPLLWGSLRCLSPLLCCLFQAFQEIETCNYPILPHRTETDFDQTEEQPGFFFFFNQKPRSISCIIGRSENRPTPPSWLCLCWQDTASGAESSGAPCNI